MNWRDDHVKRCALPEPGHGRWVFCKYCGKNVPPLVLNEHQPDENFYTQMIVCGECYAGLSSPEGMPLA